MTGPNARQAYHQALSLKDEAPGAVAAAFNSAVDKVAEGRNTDLTAMEKAAWLATMGYPIR